MSFSINTVAVDGNLTRDPELRQTSGGTDVCSLRIAHNARRKDSSGDWIDVPNYFDVTVWSGQGRWIAENISKGAKVIVQGRLQWREWEKDGNKRQSVDIVADGIIVAEGRNGGGGGRFSPQDDTPADTPPVTAQASASDDDDIPF